MSQALSSIPLPKTVAELTQQRKGRFERTLNDLVEESYLRLWDKQDFRDLLAGVSDAECVEGSESCDDHEAARMIREDFLKRGDKVHGEKPIHSLKLALRVVMRRYRTSRKERRIMLGGTLTPASE